MNTDSHTVVVEPSALHRVLEASSAGEQLHAALSANLERRGDVLLIPHHAIPEMFASSDASVSVAKAKRLRSLLEKCQSRLELMLPLQDVLELEGRQKVDSTSLRDLYRTDDVIGQIGRIADGDTATANSMREDMVKFKRRLEGLDLNTRKTVNSSMSTYRTPLGFRGDIRDVQIVHIVLNLATMRFHSQAESVLAHPGEYRFFFAWAGLQAANAIYGAGRQKPDPNSIYDDILASCAACSRVLLTNDIGLQHKIDILIRLQLVGFQANSLIQYLGAAPREQA